MKPIHRSFARQFAGAVVAALIPVVLVAFWSVPFNLGGHPGEVRAAAMSTPTRMAEMPQSSLDTGGLDDG